MTNLNPEFDSTFALIFSRSIGQSEQSFVERVIGYASTAHLRIPSGEGPSFSWKYGVAVIVSLDTTKTYSDDISFLFGDFWNGIKDYLANGSPGYVKPLRGRPVGFQLIPSIGFNAEILEIISDTVWPDNEPYPVIYSEKEIEEQVDVYLGTKEDEEVEVTPVLDGKIMSFGVPDGVKEVIIKLVF